MEVNNFAKIFTESNAHFQLYHTGIQNRLKSEKQEACFEQLINHTFFSKQIYGFCDTLKKSNPDVSAEPIMSNLIKTTVKMFSNGDYESMFEASVHKKPAVILMATKETTVSVVNK